MPTCPNGHQSGSEDWCEVCGHRMAGPGAPAGAVPPPPPPPPAPGYGYPQGLGPDATAHAEICPQCRTPREAMAPFCEECRWNFLTNTATSYTPLAPQHGIPGGGPGGPGGPGPVPGLNLPPGFQAQQPPGPPQPRDPFEYQGSRPSQVNRPAEPLSSGPGQPGPGQSPFQQGQPGQGRQGPPPPPPYQQGQGPHAQPGPQGFPGQQHAQQQGSSQGSPPPPSFQQQSAASPFQQTAPPVFEQSGPPAPPQAAQPGGDDWLLSPPSQAQGPQTPMQQRPYPGRNQGPGAGQDQGQGPDQGQGHVPASTSWTAVVAPDREYFLAMMQRSGPEATGLNLPAYSPEQHLPLTGNQITVGRRRHSTGESPDIDLSVPPEDPGVSHQHAVLVQQPDGSWAVVDQNSTNGTTLNGAEDPIQPYVPVPLQDGDQVHVGAWTTITIRRG
ncbi:FHA domain-containing protein [Streptomyces brevispora]|uniref:FHA domain-containing protein n=1 Tax=Streptomyces brevispora TaxID=887462 RepID=UPI0037182733